MNKYIITPMWNKILAVIIAAMSIYFVVRIIRYNPQAFSRDALSKSIFTMGILALILIGFIALCVWFLRHSS